MVKELPGRERVIIKPENLKFSVFGETLVGFSSVFSSDELAEVNTIDFPLPVGMPALFKST